MIPPPSVVKSSAPSSIVTKYTSRQTKLKSRDMFDFDLRKMIYLDFQLPSLTFRECLRRRPLKLEAQSGGRNAMIGHAGIIQRTLPSPYPHDIKNKMHSPELGIKWSRVRRRMSESHNLYFGSTGMVAFKSLLRVLNFAKTPTKGGLLAIYV